MTTRARLRTLDEQIDELCEKHQIFRRQIADKMGVSHPYISQIISRGGTAEHIEKITSALVELGVRINGKPVEPNYFETYAALVLLNEARSGDEGAVVAAKWYRAYRDHSDDSSKQKAMLAALLRQLQKATAPK